jgi:hypothetical protein
MAVQVSPGYAGLMASWSGDLVVRTVHGTAAQKTRQVSARDTMVITELGVLISWSGAAPTGVFIPWDEITSIEQE